MFKKKIENQLSLKGLFVYRFMWKNVKGEGKSDNI